MSSVNVAQEVFPSEYFSGCTISVYFDDELIDDIVQLEFMMQEQVMPIYGYNSYTFDRLIRGARLIQGSFAINFKSNNYIQKALGQFVDREIKKETKNIDGETKQRMKDDFETSNEKDYRKKSDLLKERIWGRFEDKQPSNNPSNLNTEGFDIRISYGRYDRNQAIRNNPNKHHKLKQRHSKEYKGTVKAINDVYLTGTSQTIELSGQPVKEVYTFVAKDIDIER